MDLLIGIERGSLEFRLRAGSSVLFHFHYTPYFVYLVLGKREWVRHLKPTMAEASEDTASPSSGG